MIEFDTQLICGVGFTVEYIKGEWVDEPFTDWYIFIDVLCFRFLIKKG